MTAHIISGKFGQSTVEATGELTRETEKAVCISGIWFPKSQITRKDAHPDQVGYFFTDWIIQKKWDDIVDAGILK